MEPSFKFALGDRVKDKITGCTGIVTCQCRWLYGCLRYIVQSQEMKDGKPVESQGYDEGSLDLVDSPLTAPAKPPGGGPAPNPSRGCQVK